MVVNTLGELRPCPFCGVDLIKVDAFSTRSVDHFVHPAPEIASYDTCIMVGLNLRSDDPDRTAAWNRRALASTPEGEPS
jgi:hypothetical protein